MLVVTDSSWPSGSKGVAKALSIRFATRMASRSVLHDFPIDLVKIDRSLIAGIKNDPESQTLVAAIVALAHSLDLKVVGKGVENPQQLAHLGLLSCNLAQGHYLAEALPPGKVAEAVRLIERYFGTPQDSASRY